MTASLTQEVRCYWSHHIHDASITRHPVGTREFFDHVEDYRFGKQSYLRTLVEFSAYQDKKLLEIGCGVGIDLVLFAKGGAHVTGIDLSQHAIELARMNFELHGLKADLRVMDGEDLKFGANTFDVVYAHGVLPYTPDVERMIREIRRVLKPGGEAIIQAYNRGSWLYVLSKVTKVRLEHEDAPVFHTHTITGFERMLRDFTRVELFVERFPIKTRLHGGLKGALYNTVFVGIFNAIPRPLVRRFGWHIIAKAVKE